MKKTYTKKQVTDFLGNSQKPVRQNLVRMETAEKDPLAELGVLAKALSEMAEPLEYRIAVMSGCWEFGLYVFDKKKNQVASLCAVPLEDSKESSAKALLRKYESLNFRTAYFYDNWDSLTFPGGTLEEIELKAAIGIKALFSRSDWASRRKSWL